jgi:CheY-like chemotaxis protein
MGMNAQVLWSGTQRILIVDDEPDIHAITRLSLKALTRKAGPTEILSAFTGKEALDLMVQHPDIGVLLLDVVMESDTAGLDACRAIREELRNPFVRILLRTGQPGVAPEQQTIDSYDIDGYLAKTETSSSRLYTSVRCALKSYQELIALERHRAYLAATHDCAVALRADVGVERMLESVLETVLLICPSAVVLLELETFEHGEGPRHVFLHLSADADRERGASAAEGARARVQRALASSELSGPALVNDGFFVPLSLHRELGHGWLFVDGVVPDGLAQKALTLLAGHAQNAIYSSLALSASRERRALVFEAVNI